LSTDGSIRWLEIFLAGGDRVTASGGLRQRCRRDAAIGVGAEFCAGEHTALTGGRVTAMRKGFNGSSALTAKVLAQDAFSGHLFVFPVRVPRPHQLSVSLRQVDSRTPS
jgi:hypothetical protein